VWQEAEQCRIKRVRRREQWDDECHASQSERGERHQFWMFFHETWEVAPNEPNLSHSRRPWTVERTVRVRMSASVETGSGCSAAAVSVVSGFVSIGSDVYWLNTSNSASPMSSTTSNSRTNATREVFVRMK